MSPLSVSGHPSGCGFPRVSGDEPHHAVDGVPEVEFSPRERG